MDDIRAAMIDLFVEANHLTGRGTIWSVRYPWYDAHWLSYFVDAREYLADAGSPMLDEFLEATSALRISKGSFTPVTTEDLFDQETIARIRSEISSQPASRLEKDELAAFGRDVIHDNPFFIELQTQTASRVGEIVGEEVEVSYNFLSLYGSDGHCPIHMDAPEAKWTLDICIDQSRRWPIHISEVVDWPENWPVESIEDWETQLKQQHGFSSYELEPGQALLFGGSSQWHYRDEMQAAVETDFCTLLFFHFIPKGTSEIVDHGNWPNLFGLPEWLAEGR